MDAKIIAEAWAREEGFYVAGSIPQRANNPGDLELGDIGFGKLGEGVTVFDSAAAGWNALYAQIARMLTGKSHVYALDMTLAQVGLEYSGGDPNWSKNVAALLKVPETITLAELAIAPDPSLL